MLESPIIFLDIDGVLNDHGYDEQAASSTLIRECVDRLNIVITHTRCNVVVSSSWRYMVHGGAMTVRGLEYLLRTHGLRVNKRLIGVTREDESPDEPRARQIIDWWRDRRPYDDAAVPPWVVLDDLDLGFSRVGMPFVQTDGESGLSDADVESLMTVLGGTGRTGGAGEEGA